MILRNASAVAISLFLFRYSHGQQPPHHNIRKGAVEGVKVNKVSSTPPSTDRSKSGLARYDLSPSADEKDPDFHLKPKTVGEVQKIANEQNDKKSQELSQTLPMTHSELNSLDDQQAQTDSDISPNTSGGDNGHRNLSTSQNTRHLTVEQCNGMRKIVQCKDDVAEEVCKHDLVWAGVQVVADMPKTVFFSICVDSQAEADLVAELTDVEGVEDDPPRTLSYIPESVVARHLQGQNTPYGVDLVKAPEFWSRFNKRGEGVKVCVIDTGLRATHRDLRDGDMGGTDDRSLVTPWNQDATSHGTHCTGTIAAQDNSEGVVGVAPGVAIHTVRVFGDSGSFSASNLITAMYACADAGSNVISMSLGAPVSTFAESSVIDQLNRDGILLVAASGNDGNRANLVNYPASYDGVMSVGALDADAQIAIFSTHNTGVDISGPGVGVLSTTSVSDTSYAEFSGTSMSTPHVAAVAALLWSQFPNKDAYEIREALQESARDIGACGKDRLFGHGMVDTMAAADYLENGNDRAPELSGCVDVSVRLKTDDYGLETTYVITPKNANDDIVYRGGPYPNGRRSIYSDEINVQDGCFQIALLDSYGDGSDNPDFGIGSLEVSYNGDQQVDFTSLTGSRKTFEFGNCGNGGSSPTNAPVPSPTNAPIPSPTNAPIPSPTSAPIPGPTSAPIPSPTSAPIPSPTSAPIPSPTSAPVVMPRCGNGIIETGEECDDGDLSNSNACTNACKLNVCGDGFTEAGVEECDDGNTDDGDGCNSSCAIEQQATTTCDAGESRVNLVLRTDRWARSENQLYFFDTTAPEDAWIWIIEIFEFRGNSLYEGSTCIDLSKCHKFFFLDSFGDGIDSGGLILTQDGVVVLDIGPYDKGIPVEGGVAAEYWFHLFGECESTAATTSD